MDKQSSLYSTLRTEIAGQLVSDLACQFGTPLYVYDAAKIVAQVESLKTFDTIRYAQKASSNLAILDLVRRHGGLVDAVSYGEILRALKVGFTPEGDPPGIVFTADIFDHDTLDLVVEKNIHVNCGSPDMISQLGERASGHKITLRINPGFGHGHSQKTNTGGEQSKHGIWHEQLNDCLQRANHCGLSVTGLHMHIGSGTDLKHLSQVCVAMEEMARKVGGSITNISAGGGLPISYHTQESVMDIEGYYRLWNKTRENLSAEFGHPIHLEIEPGRYLVAESGCLVTEIRAVKQMGENTFYLVDAGFNNLARPILYGAYHPMSICPSDGNENRPMREVVVGGPLCESGDIFTQKEGGFVARRELPAASVGDLLMIECAGAYGFAMGSNYNSKPLAAEVMVAHGQPHLVRARQTFEDLVCGESILPE